MIKRGINKIKRVITHQQWKSETISLSEIPSSLDADVQNFIKTLEALQANNWSKEEKQQLNKIQDIRNKYSSSNQSINITDYGAGDPNLTLSDNEMNKGVPSKSKISDVYKQAATSEKFGELIFKIIRNFKPENCLELGTSLGVSGAYQVSAMQLNDLGHFTSIEGSKDLADIANQTLNKFNFSSYQIHIGKFVDVLPDILSKDHPIDLVFIDGHHDRQATLAYYGLIYPYLSTRSIVIFDDINWSNGMQKCWNTIYSEEKGIKAAFDLFYWGICLIDKESEETNRICYKINY